MPYRFNPFTKKLDEVDLTEIPPGGFVSGPATSSPGDLAYFTGTMGNFIGDSGINKNTVLLNFNNLSDVSSAPTARTNLGLTNVATATTTTNAVLIGAASNSIGNAGPGLTNQVLNGNTGLAPTFGPVPAGALPGSGQITLSSGENITVMGSPVALGGTATIAVNDPILLSNGSTSNPSYSFSLHTGSGFYTDSSGNVHCAVGGNDNWVSQFTFQVDAILETFNGMTFAYTDAGSSPYTEVGNHIFISVNTSSGAFTVKLPNGPRQSQVFVVKDRTGNAGTHNITVTTSGGTVTIDGSTTYAINVNYGSAMFMWNGTSYEVF